jgi:hypothetical protein
MSKNMSMSDLDTNIDIGIQWLTAMRRCPDMTALEVLEYVLDWKYPTRRSAYSILDDDGPQDAWKPTNSDILRALADFNAAKDAEWRRSLTHR